MRKRRFFALLCALLLLLALSACKRDEQQDPSAEGDGTSPSAPEAEQNDAATGEHPFSVRFEYNGIGFDTAAGTLFTPDSVTARSFANDLTALRDRLDECNAYEIGRIQSDLTYQALSAGAQPTGENTLYTISFTADGNAGTVTIDTAAINAYAASNSHVSNIGALVDSLINLIAYWNGTLS